MDEQSAASEARVVREVLQEVSARGGRAIATLLYEADGTAPNRDLRILVNGRSVAFLAGLDTQLAPGDTVTLHLAGARGYPGG